MNETTNETQARALRKKPELVTIGDRVMIDRCRWNDDLMSTYVLNQGHSKWLLVADLARVAYGQNIRASRDRVRRRLPGLFRHMLLNHAVLLSVEYAGKRHQASAVKIFDRSSIEERQMIRAKAERMAARRELSASMLQTVEALLVEPSAATESSP